MECRRLVYKRPALHYSAKQVQNTAASAEKGRQRTVFKIYKNQNGGIEDSIILAIELHNSWAKLNIIHNLLQRHYAGVDF